MLYAQMTAYFSGRGLIRTGDGLQVHTFKYSCEHQVEAARKLIDPGNTGIMWTFAFY